VPPGKQGEIGRTTSPTGFLPSGVQAEDSGNVIVGPIGTLQWGNEIVKPILNHMGPLGCHELTHIHDFDNFSCSVRFERGPS
jgi:hypothetical protein